MSVNIKINGQTVNDIHAVQFENADAPGTNIQFYDVNSVQEEKTVTPTTSVQEVVPSSEKLLSKVTVEGVTAGIDNNIQAQNIKEGVSILGVTGQYQTPSQEKSVSPTTSEQEVTPDSGKLLSKVIVNAVTSSVDSNITGGNIKHGVEILGVVGNYGGVPPVSEITDLTGTMWLLNETLNLNYQEMKEVSYGRYIIAGCFPDNKQSFDCIYFETDTSLKTYGMYYNSGPTPGLTSLQVYTTKYMTDNCRTVIISGGRRATNETLVQWFKNNATLIGVIQQ